MAEIKQNIVLNFLPLSEQDFSFKVYRRAWQHGEKTWDENIRRYNLPTNIIDTEHYTSYWVSFRSFDNAERLQVNALTNIHLTEWYLYYLLHEKINNCSDLIMAEKKQKFNPFRLYFEIEKFNEGIRTIWLEPYYLKQTQKFGFLIGFKFFKYPNQPFNRRVQQLSFSLDQNGLSNKNYNIDVYRFIYNFVDDKLNHINPLKDSLEISNTFENIQNDLLATKIYVFANKSTNNSQYNGIIQNGPFEEVDNSNLTYNILFKEGNDSLVYEFIKAINGEKFITFKGIVKFILPNLTPKQNIKATRVKDFSTDNLKDTVEKVGINGILIAIIPAKESQFYYHIKNLCLQKNIPLQVVHIETINNDNVLKWSVSSIALQIFTKLGGTPWLVKTNQNNSLIVGIGQSLSRANNLIKRFYAYSVLVESSGKFLSLKPIADTVTREEFLTEIGYSISQIITENAQRYQRIVFHIPQKIKYQEIEKIKDTITQVNRSIEISILRINDNSKLLGFHMDRNSLYPFESTFAQLSHKEYLLWTEGLNYHQPDAKKRYANPIYIEFYYSNKVNINHKEYLQEVLNLSGANYRGFNAKALPVSLFYPKLISNFNKHFEEIGIEQIYSENKKPWFL